MIDFYSLSVRTIFQKEIQAASLCKPLKKPSRMSWCASSLQKRLCQGVSQCGKRTDDDAGARAEDVEEAAGTVNPGSLQARRVGPGDTEGVGGDQAHFANRATGL